MKPRADTQRLHNWWLWAIGSIKCHCYHSTLGTPSATPRTLERRLTEYIVVLALYNAESSCIVSFTVFMNASIASKVDIAKGWYMNRTAARSSSTDASKMILGSGFHDLFDTNFLPPLHPP